MEGQAQENGQITKPQDGWVKFLRVVIWVVVAVGIPLGIGLISRGRQSAAMAQGMNVALEMWGHMILWLAVFIGIWNLTWGVARWGLRWRREKWKPGRVAGKVIGGGIWRTLVVVPIVLVSLVWVTPACAKMISGNTLESLERERQDSSMMIAADYGAGKITTDEYVSLMIDTAYDKEALPREYWSDNEMIAPNIAEMLMQYKDELSDETIEKGLKATLMTNVRIDTDASGNVAARESWFGENAYATTKSVTTLNKAVLSSRGRFVVIYTDTGEDAITDEEAREIGEMMEEIVEGYEEKMGLQYSYEMHINPLAVDTVIDSVQEYGFLKMLKQNGLPTDTLATAMPVYAANPVSGESNTLASYESDDTYIKLSMMFGNELAKLLGLDGEEIEKTMFYYTFLSFPAVMIRPDALDRGSMEIIVAHELGHHYAHLHCKRYGMQCSTEKFIGETIANWMAVSVVDPEQQTPNNTIQRHLYRYLDSTYVQIDRINSNFLGYPPFLFLFNYEAEVADGNNKILDALLTDNALEYLVSQATEEEMKRVMTNLTVNNLAVDNYSLVSQKAPDNTWPKGDSPKCADFCTRTYEMGSSFASRYMYFAGDEYKDVRVQVQAGGESEVVLIWMGEKDGKWEVLQESDSQIDYLMGRDDYEAYALAATTYTFPQYIWHKANYTVHIEAEEIENVLKDNVSCKKFNMEDILDLPVKFYQALQSWDDSQEYQDGLDRLEQETEEAKVALDYKTVEVCQYMVIDVEEKKALASLTKMFKPVFGFWDFNIEGVLDLKYGFNYDILTSDICVYAFVPIEKTKYFYTLTFGR